MCLRVMADSVIYHGPMGTAGYQCVTNRMLPLRGLDDRFNRWLPRLLLRIVVFLVPRLRAWERNRALLPCSVSHRHEGPGNPDMEFNILGKSREDVLHPQRARHPAD